MKDPTRPVIIRLARFGRVRQPQYNIVVARKHKARNSLPLEVIGTYNPIAQPLTAEEIARGVKPFKDIQLDFHRAKYWLGVGAETLDRVGWLFKKANLVPQEWPKPSKLTQIAPSTIVSEAREVMEEPVDRIRERE